jgi:hypothetical protein
MGHKSVCLIVMSLVLRNLAVKCTIIRPMARMGSY